MKKYVPVIQNVRYGFLRILLFLSYYGNSSRGKINCACLDKQRGKNN